MKVLGFLLGTTDRLVSRVLLRGLFGGLLAAGVTLLVASEGTQEWPPHQLTYVAMITIGVFAAYAIAVSVLLRAAASRLVNEVAAAQHAEVQHAQVQHAEQVASVPDHGALSS